MASGLSCVREQRLDAFAERFAAAGDLVLAFDYRHFGGSGGSPRFLMNGARQRDDWRAAIAYARALEGVDPTRVALWGFSLGGGSLQTLCIGKPGTTAAIFVAPVVDGLRTLLYMGGVKHVARLGIAGVRDALLAPRGAEPYRSPPPAHPARRPSSPPRVRWPNSKR